LPRTEVLSSESHEFEKAGQNMDRLAVGRDGQNRGINRWLLVRVWGACLALGFGSGAFLIAADMSENPLLQESSLPYRYPHFDRVRDEHFGPAYEAGMVEHARKIGRIANNPVAPTFENTIVAMAGAGQTVDRMSRVFGNLNGTITNPQVVGAGEGDGAEVGGARGRDSIECGD
jgi:hypothetical protein